MRVYPQLSPGGEIGCGKALEKSLFWVLPETFGIFYHFEHSETLILTPAHYIEFVGCVIRPPRVGGICCLPSFSCSTQGVSQFPVTYFPCSPMVTEQRDLAVGDDLLSLVMLR